MSDFDESLFAPAFIAAGMWVLASVLLAGTDVPVDVYVDFARQDVNPFTGVVSTDYEMEYERASLPTLAEGDQVSIAGELYRVRRSPLVWGAQASGHFRKALLTKV